MGTQSLAIILGCLALSDYFVVTDARWHPPPPPGPPGNDGKWVWNPGLYKPESSSSSSTDWSGDGYLNDEGLDGDGDAHEEVVIIATKPTEPAVIVVITEAPPKLTTYPPTEPATIPTPEPKPYEPPAKEEPVVYEEFKAEVVYEEVEYDDDDDDEEEEEEEDSNYVAKIVGAARPIEETTETSSNIPVGGIIGAAAAATVLAAMAALFAKKRQAANAETEIDPEENDDLMLEEDMFVGEIEDNDIPPPPPMEANEDGIELDESFFHLPDGADQEHEVDNAYVASDGLESV